MKTAIIENIEMKLFASFGSSLHHWTKEDTKLVLSQTKPEVPCKGKKAEEALDKPVGKDAPAVMYVEGEGSPPVNETDLPAEAIEIEMEVLHPYKDDIMGIESGDPSVLSPDPEKPLTPWDCKSNKPKWRRMEVKSIGLVVKDVICLPYGTYLKQDDLYNVPSNKEREILASMGLIARITIDSSWLNEEMEGRLASIFKHRFCRSRAERFLFTYLTCFQGSHVLLDPKVPCQSYTAQDVLRICENGSLYILSHHHIVTDTVEDKFSDPLKAC
ncbi:hypothetical protein AALO_G00120320 [Alosa alosa]|uniref:Uncharacterized protein n=1 Tax=Alosa alosa TaxID=278164 RepID=A0AAV6GLU7_9TELE|nr:uncharacterized protein LOC125301023 [Alosa alosa]KAG5275439.1 hypothetical protein AALO_G00120320 [Alosa alosa]